MADRSLIEGQRAVSKSEGFVDYGAKVAKTDFAKGAAMGVDAQNRARKSKVAAINQAVNTNMSRMKSDVDLTGYSKEEQKGIRNFLIAQRNRYAEAASAAAKIGDASSPDYQYYVDIMNSVNNSFSNLRSQLNSYKENKVEFAEGVRSGLWSEGNEDGAYAKAARMYGLVDGKKTDASFKIGEDGNLGFDIDGEIVSYSDFEQPFTKDFATANKILKLSSDLYTAGNELSGPKKDMLRMQLSSMLTDPNTMKSLIKDFDGDGLKLSDIVYNEQNPEETRDNIINRLLGSFGDVAAQGKAEKDSRRGGKGGANNYDKWANLSDNFAQHRPIKGTDGYTFVWNEDQGGYVGRDADGLAHVGTMRGDKEVALKTPEDLAALLGVQRPIK